MINLSYIDKSIISENRVDSLVVKKYNSTLIVDKRDKCSYIINPLLNKNTKNLFIYICRKSHVSYFEDYITSLDITDIHIYYDKMIDLEYIKYSGNIIFLVMFDLDENLFSLNISKKNCYIFNMEQMTILERFLAIKPFYDNDFNLIGYSITHQQCFPKEIYIPYQHSEEEINKLKSYSTDLKYDVCMYDSL
jgi:hypothetical protein